MELFNIDFNDVLQVEINGQKILIHLMKEREPNTVKLGIDAPKSIAVNREEVYRAKKRIEQIIDEKEAVPGRIKTFDVKRGMGFASLRELNQDIFIHYKFFKK